MMKTGRFNVNHMGNRKKSFSYGEWLACLSNYSSLHGWAWYERTHNKFYRSVIFITGIAALLAMPIVLATQIVKYLQEGTVGLENFC